MFPGSINLIWSNLFHIDSTWLAVLVTVYYLYGLWDSFFRHSTSGRMQDPLPKLDRHQSNSSIDRHQSNSSKTF